MTCIRRAAVLGVAVMAAIVATESDADAQLTDIRTSVVTDRLFEEFNRVMLTAVPCGNGGRPNLVTVSG